MRKINYLGQGSKEIYHQAFIFILWCYDFYIVLVVIKLASWKCQFSVSFPCRFEFSFHE